MLVRCKVSCVGDNGRIEVGEVFKLIACAKSDLALRDIRLIGVGNNRYTSVANEERLEKFFEEHLV